MMSYATDPGGIFASDTHRRVLAVVPNPDEASLSLADLVRRLDRDPYVPLGTTLEEEVLGVLTDLASEKYIQKVEGGWQHTDQGREALSAPPPTKDKS